ncbi:MAG: YlmH/Sll1252 family protein [Clostridia bacterium]|nr:YlmH/Sll1252 family protein [Clostridia bacterium]
MDILNIVDGLEQSERLFFSRVIDKIKRVERIHSISSTSFLDPYQQKVIDSILNQFQGVQGIFKGGYPYAERKLLILKPFYYQIDELPEFISCLRIIGNSKSCELKHKDFLGGILGMGITREKVGDIVLDGKNRCFCFVCSDMVDYLNFNLQKIGNSKVSVEKVDISSIDIPEKEYKKFDAIVSSLRLDAVISAAYRLSRKMSAEYITNRSAKINWQIVDDVSKQVQEGDIISLKKYGRVILNQVTGYTKKKRLKVEFKKML